MTKAMQVLIVTSFVAGVLALQNACTRYLYVLGRNRLAPARCGTVNVRTGTPGFAGITQTLLTLVALVAFGLTSADPYTQIVPWTNTPTLVAVLLLQAATCCAVIRYFAQPARRAAESLRHRMIAPALAAVLLGAALLCIANKMGMLTGLGGP
ncbi:hypothetical protein ABT009_34045 [Streptomyces sp. NPDC002896]|uniref:hypothetical protein n=1 Tax=Streptomyces sp. NPDC002896 TaxID=3154438 RepID=UPI0033300A2A